MEIQAKFGIEQTFYFPLITAGGTGFQDTWTPAAGETLIIIDGGTAANATNNPTSETNGLWSLTMTAAELSGTRISVIISDGETDIEDQCLIISTLMSGQIEASQGIIIGEVDTATFTATTTALEAFRLSPNVTEEATADHYNGRLILFTSGALLGQMTDITDYTQANSKEKFTYTALTEAPADADRFVIL